MTTSAPSKTAVLLTRPPRLLLIEDEGAGAATAEDRIACEGCGDSFSAPDGGALHYALKGSCAHCGGEFRLRPAL